MGKDPRLKRDYESGRNTVIVVCVFGCRICYLPPKPSRPFCISVEAYKCNSFDLNGPEYK